MDPLPIIPYVELRVPKAQSEQEFVRLAVQAAVKKYREAHRTSINRSLGTGDDTYPLQESAC
jgi:hypothetical protein